MSDRDERGPDGLTPNQRKWLALSDEREMHDRIRDDAYRAGFDTGRDPGLLGYQDGYNLGHDTGLSARQDSRAYVHGILEGWEDGCAARHAFVEERRVRDAQQAREARQAPAAGARHQAPDRSQPERQVSGRRTRRPAAREAEPEREAG
jgi:hypothetical protein